MNVLDVAPVSAGLLVAESVYPVPVLLIDRVLNVATPPDAATVAVPLSVPALGFVPIASVTFLVSEVTTLLFASRICTVIAGVMEAPAAVFVGCWLNTRCVAVPGVMLNVLDVAPVSAGLLVAESVYPVPVLLIDRVLNVATPPEAVTVVVPLSVPPPGFVPMTKVI